MDLILPRAPSYPQKSVDEDINLRFTFRGRHGFMYRGRIRIDDGFVTDSSGNTTTYAILRPYVFADPDNPPPNTGAQIEPGYLGHQRFNFMRGSVVIRAAEFKTLILASSPTHQWLDGKVSLIETSSLGSLRAFAVWRRDVDQDDPYQFYVESATQLEHGGVTQKFVRHNAVFVPHRRAKYLGVGARVYDIPNSGPWRNQYFDRWMVEQAPPGSQIPPSPKYRKAREVVVTVKPDRLNMMPNPGFDVDTSGWEVSGGTLEQDPLVYRIGGGSGRWETSAANTECYSVPGLVPSGTRVGWIGSLYVQGTGRVRLILRGRSADEVDTILGVSAPMNLGSEFRRIHAWGLTREDTSSVYLAVEQLSPGNHTVYVDDALLERGYTLRPYFDGSTSADTLWEGAAGKSRSYLYKNRLARYTAIRRVLEDNVPLGIGIAEPVFASPTLVSEYVGDPGSAPPPTLSTIYGDGLYGDGPYGG